MVLKRNSFLTSLGHWEVKEQDNLDLDEIRLRFFDLPQRMSNLANQLDEYGKIFLLSQSVQMVLGGLKCGATIYFDNNLIKEFERRRMIEGFDAQNISSLLFEHFHLCLTDALDQQSPAVSKYYLYNPELLRKISAKVKALDQYRGEDINEWIERQIHKGLTKCYVKGMINGYPISAVKQHDQYQNDNACRIDQRRVINNYGESYVVWGKQLKRDVRIRESVKDAFFTNLSANQVYRDLIAQLNSQAMKYRQISQYNFERMISLSSTVEL